MPNLHTRSYQAELIDDLNLSNQALAQNLRELATINKWLGGNSLTVSGLKAIFASNPQASYHIADLGCGGGDMLKMMAKYCQKKHINAKFTGFDANQFMVDYASTVCQHLPNVALEKEDVFSESFANKTFDIACLTLFCHHFTEDQLVQLFATLKQNCRQGFVVNDLHRHPLAYYAIWLLTSLFSKSYLVKNDARLSVWRGFARAELAHILAKAGLGNYRLRWRWAFRWELVVFTA
jgi:SAM-dependent methyltransferase